ncbi:hypothetical protein DNU06_12000 [Putridiphycobacter roseus]|uniref:HMA domain-containing protein n=1 Tax=Putridiphycobacter roseus TaxID=2219161 RepID=A0A2W1MZ91_9FLAO|nr:heavy-metal-associated domain-containing protein [Putridiphycobacter roseus]PZE16570.1 hypothetical protein DNU06_12000 [Putridiphycobacter roseus]
MRNLLLLAFVAFLSTGFTQSTTTITIKTSALCGDCKERIENELNYTKGVKFAELDLESNFITVKYKTKKTSEKIIKEAVTNLGYHANEMERNSAAFSELPGCCQDPNATCTKK